MGSWWWDYAPCHNDNRMFAKYHLEPNTEVLWTFSESKLEKSLRSFLKEQYIVELRSAVESGIERLSVLSGPDISFLRVSSELNHEERPAIFFAVAGSGKT
jgi:hypothetical protein